MLARHSTACIAKKETVFERLGSPNPFLPSGPMSFAIISTRAEKQQFFSLSPEFDAPRHPAKEVLGFNGRD
jgi:hypothetical protein